MDEEQRGGGAFGTYVRAQRRLARLSLRQLSELTQISNPYLSQIERGLHQPSVTVIKNLARALGVSVEALLAQAAGVGGQAADVGGQDGAPTDEPAGPPGVEEAVAADPGLDDTQKTALLAVYRSMVAAGEPSAPAPAQSPVASPAPSPSPAAGRAAATRAAATKATTEEAAARRPAAARKPAAKKPAAKKPAAKKPAPRKTAGTKAAGNERAATATKATGPRARP